jgi:hypothetical protein
VDAAILENQPVHQYRRRESSYTDALDDPLRYLDQVKKFLGTAGEDDDLVVAALQAKADTKKKEDGGVRKRINSGVNAINPKAALLEEINEENATHAESIKPKEVAFIKNQF